MMNKRGLRLTIGGTRYKFNANKFFNEGLGAWIIIAAIALGMAAIFVYGLDNMTFIYHR